MELKDKVALITGGGRGIGRAIALTFADQGAGLALAARTREQLEKVVEEAKELGSVAFPLVCDVTDEQSVVLMVKGALERFGHLDILVNNAGGVKTAPLVKTDLALWNEMIQVNLTSTYLCTRAVLPHLLERKWGRIINISSTAGKIGGAYIAAYSAAKHGVLGFTRSLALEVATSGITVNAICPGYVETEMLTQSVARIKERTGMEPNQVREYLANLSPQKRLMQPQEVANAALFLARDESGGINGQAINLCGGWVMA